ncbi:MAG: hypothetical protein Q7R71_01520 [bacterium]|nr:hypothetical protein [bacterium]
MGFFNSAPKPSQQEQTPYEKLKLEIQVPDKGESDPNPRYVPLERLRAFHDDVKSLPRDQRVELSEIYDRRASELFAKEINVAPKTASDPNPGYQPMARLEAFIDEIKGFPFMAEGTRKELLAQAEQKRNGVSTW